MTHIINTPIFLGLIFFTLFSCHSIDTALVEREAPTSTKIKGGVDLDQLKLPPPPNTDPIILTEPPADAEKDEGPDFLSQEVILSYSCRASRADFRKLPKQDRYFNIYVIQYRVAKIGRFPLCQTLQISRSKRKKVLDDATGNKEHCVNNIDAVLDNVRCRKIKNKPI